MNGDNCSKNNLFADICNLPLIECPGHRVNLAVNDLLEDYDDVQAAIHSLMGKLKGLLLTARLRKITSLVPQTKKTIR